MKQQSLHPLKPGPINTRIKSKKRQNKPFCNRFHFMEYDGIHHEKYLENIIKQEAPYEIFHEYEIFHT
jgi:hypothetical protein